MQNRKLNICILARKRIIYNTRIKRQAYSLAQKGHNVVIVSLESGSQEKVSSNVEYIDVKLNPWPIKLVRLYRRVVIRVKRSLNKIVIKIIFVLYLWKEVKRLLNRIIAKLTLKKLLNSKSKTKENLEKKESYFDRSLNYILSYLNFAQTSDFAKQSYKILKNRNFDCIQAHDSFSLLAAKKLAKKNKAILIYDAVEIPEDRSGSSWKDTPKWLYWWEQKRDKKIIKSAHLVITIGSSLSDWFKNRHDISPIIIRNCPIFKNPCPKKRIKTMLNLSRNIKVITYIGSIYERMGADKLIESLKYLNYSTHIVLLGPETQRDYCKYLIDKAKGLQVCDRFHILPPVSPQEVIDYAAEADIGVIPLQKKSLNLFYALPNKIFEMIMARLPIAASNLPNIKQIIEEFKCGKMFDETDPKSIAYTINEMLKPETYNKLKENVSKAAEELCWEKEGQKYVRAVENLFEKYNR